MKGWNIQPLEIVHGVGRRGKLDAPDTKGAGPLRGLNARGMALGTVSRPQPLIALRYLRLRNALKLDGHEFLRWLKGLLAVFQGVQPPPCLPTGVPVDPGPLHPAMRTVLLAPAHPTHPLAQHVHPQAIRWRVR